MRPFSGGRLLASGPSLKRDYIARGLQASASTNVTTKKSHLLVGLQMGGSLLTYKLKRATTLRELQLLASGPFPGRGNDTREPSGAASAGRVLNAIHLAAIATRAAELGAGSDPYRAAALLDRHCGKLADMLGPWGAEPSPAAAGSVGTLSGRNQAASSSFKWVEGASGPGAEEGDAAIAGGASARVANIEGRRLDEPADHQAWTFRCVPLCANQPLSGTLVLPVSDLSFVCTHTCMLCACMRLSSYLFKDPG